MLLTHEPRLQIGLLGVLLFLAVVTLIGNQVWLSDPNHEDAWYLDMKGGATQPVFYNFLTYIILYNMLIPISLVVTLEVVKLAQAQMFINNDLDLYDKGSDTPARAISSTLNEELGQVQYIFSDKTGTLTRNIMMFLKCSIGGIAYGDDVQQVCGVNIEGPLCAVLLLPPPKNTHTHARAHAHTQQQRLRVRGTTHQLSPDLSEIVHDLASLLSVAFRTQPSDSLHLLTAAAVLS